jgi:putative hydrolase of the HAD superfamily
MKNMAKTRARIAAPEKNHAGRWDSSTMIKTITFDLGDTLIYYDGVALNWSNHYVNALTVGFERSGVGHQALKIGECEDVLRKFNTRINPRDKEYPAAEIFRQIGVVVGANETQQNVIMDELFQCAGNSECFALLTPIKRVL